tara:strand:+ start:267 stop:788 length:522 start_codon:yes stop_codon:yes gene_type:complete
MLCYLAKPDATRKHIRGSDGDVGLGTRMGQGVESRDDVRVNDDVHAGVFAVLTAYFRLQQLTTAEGAELLGMPVRKYNRLKSGYTSLTTSHIQDFADATALPVSLFMLPGIRFLQSAHLNHLILEAPNITTVLGQMLALPNNLRREALVHVRAVVETHHTRHRSGRQQNDELF